MTEINIDDVTYSEFVARLAKPMDILDKEISKEEDMLLDKTLVFSCGAAVMQLLNKNMLLSKSIERPEYLHNLHMIVGITGEAGELLDAFKQLVIYRRKLDHVKNGQTVYSNILEEFGDLCFYITDLGRFYFGKLQVTVKALEKLKSLIDLFNETFKDQLAERGYEPITIELAIKNNKEKLSKRYHSLTYSDKHAQERADKA